MGNSSARNFVVIQPGMMDSDVFSFNAAYPHHQSEVMYLIDRGVPEMFFTEAQIGDICFFERERFVMRVGREMNRDGIWDE